MTHSVKLHSFFVSLLVFALLLSSIALPTGIVHAINTPWLNISGRSIRDPQGNNVILRGVSLVDVSVANSRPRNAITRIARVFRSLHHGAADDPRVMSAER